MQIQWTNKFFWDERIKYLLIAACSGCVLLCTVVHIISQETREGYIASMLKMLRIYSETHTNTNLFRSQRTNLVLRAIMKWKKWDENKICHKITNWYTWNCSGSGEEILLSASRLTQFLNLILLEKQPPQFFLLNLILPEKQPSSSFFVMSYVFKCIEKCHALSPQKRL